MPAVHQEAHGNIAFSMVEVEPGFFNLLMGEGRRVDEVMLNMKMG